MSPTCPPSVPVVAIPPQQVHGFTWGPVIRPQGDACLTGIAVEPTNEHAWYVGSASGLYMTKNGGQTWTKPLAGQVTAILFVPGRSPLVYIGVEEALYLSRDEGRNWAKLHTFPWPIGSILVAHQQLFVGLLVGGPDPGGVYSSNLGGGVWTFHPFGPGQNGLLVWTLARDPQDGTLYAGTEMSVKPTPLSSYKPPFFRSTDGGANWTNVAGPMHWHVIASAVRPGDGYVYALTEGTGLYGSPDKGATWVPPAPVLAPSSSLLMHPQKPAHLFGGQQRYGTLPGGVYLSGDSGKTFHPIGLAGVTVGGLAVDGACTRLFATAYASGLYTATIPPTV
jgi:photosystem II stability/assembly factor-like uncharacterized protein